MVKCQYRPRDLFNYESHLPCLAQMHVDIKTISIVWRRQKYLRGDREVRCRMIANEAISRNHYPLAWSVTQMRHIYLKIGFGNDLKLTIQTHTQKTNSDKNEAFSLNYRWHCCSVLSESEKVVKSQWTVGGSLGSLHNRLLSFSCIYLFLRALQGAANSIFEHMVKMMASRKSRCNPRWHSCHMCRLWPSERNELACQRSETGMRVGGQTEGQSVWGGLKVPEHMSLWWGGSLGG